MHTFTNGVTFVTAGRDTVTATDAANATITGSATVSVSPASATHYSISAPPSSTAGKRSRSRSPRPDAFNNTATAYLGTAHFTKTDPGAASAVPADYPFVAGDAGVTRS